MDSTALLSVFGRNIATTSNKAWIEPNARSQVNSSFHARSPQLEPITSPDTSTPLPPTKSPPPAVKPKRPLSAYNLFFQIERKRVVASLPPNAPKIAFTDMAKIISKKWKVVNEGYKSRLIMQAKQEKLRYDNAMKKYREQLAEEVAFLQEQDAPPTVSDSEETKEPEDNFHLEYLTAKQPSFKGVGYLELPPTHSSTSTPSKALFMDPFSSVQGVPPVNQMGQDHTLEMMTRPTNILPDASIQSLACQLDDDMQRTIVSLFL